MPWTKRHRTILSWLISGVALAVYLSYKYPHNGHPEPRPRAVASDPSPTGRGPVRAVSFYAPSTGQTSVYLSGDLELLSPAPPWASGQLLLSPIFDVDGEQIRAPEGVLLRFISVARERRLYGAGVLEVLVDGASVVREARLYLPATTNVEGVVRESAGWRIPYDAFVRMAQGTDVKVRLGAEEVALGREHREALGAMVWCVKWQRCG